MQRRVHILAVCASLCLLPAAVGGQEKPPFRPVSILDVPTIAGRPVQLDANGKLLPWLPCPTTPGTPIPDMF